LHLLPQPLPLPLFCAGLLFEQRWAEEAVRVRGKEVEHVRRLAAVTHPHPPVALSEWIVEYESK
jgi:hypothetical protein